jgi:hypothetical protein
MLNRRYLNRSYLLPALAILSLTCILFLAYTVSGEDEKSLSDVCPFMSTLHERDAFVVTSEEESDRVSSATIISNFSAARFARYGNTPEEMRESDWEPYTSRRQWYLPGYNYPIRRQVYAEFRNRDLRKINTALPIYPCSDFQDAGKLPMAEIPDPRSSDKVWSDDFDQADGRWASYQDSLGYGNVFFPLSYEEAGGVDGGGYAWTDSSRWNIDAPENPDSALVALIYWRWLFSPVWRARSGLGDSVDLDDTTVSVQLRGENLDLKGGHVTFWMLCDGSRWHLKSSYLNIENDAWTTNKVLLSKDPSKWALSWSRGEPPAFCLSHVESFGFAIAGFRFSQEPTGVFQMDKLSIDRAQL